MVLSPLTPYIPEPDLSTLHEALICSATKQYNLCNYVLIQSTSTIDVYRCSLEPTINSPTKMKYIIIVIKTQDMCLSSQYYKLFVAFKYNFINLEKYFNNTILQNNSFYENVKNDINSIISVNPRPTYTFAIVGQGEGGAMVDDLLLNNYVDYGYAFNPLIETKHFKDRDSKRLASIFYSDDSPFSKTFGRLIDTANIFPWKLRYDNIDNRFIYINTKPVLVSNSVENESFYRGPGLHNWSSVSITYNGQYQLASTIYGKVFLSYNYGQTWEDTRTEQYYLSFDFRPLKLSCSKVKFGSRGNRALFLQGTRLYISRNKGSNWEHVTDVVIPYEYYNFMGRASLYVSDITGCLMVYIPGKSQLLDTYLKPLLFISYDSGTKWVDYTKRKTSSDYINFKISVQNYAANNPNYQVYTNESDLDDPIPYVEGKTPAFKFFVSIEKYLWKPTDQPPVNWTNPIFSFNDVRINVFNDLQWTRPFFREDDPEISFSEGFNKMTGVFPGRYIQYATDFGNVWDEPEYFPYYFNLHNWVYINVSYSGKYQVIAEYNNNINGKIEGELYISKDFGKNWTSVFKSYHKWKSAVISDDGKFITAVCHEMDYPNNDKNIRNKTYFDGGFICVSFDGGKTWKERR